MTKQEKRQKEKVALMSKLCMLAATPPDENDGDYTPEEKTKLHEIWNNQIKLKAKLWNMAPQRAEQLMKKVSIKMATDASAVDYCGTVANEMMMFLFKGMPTMADGAIQFFPGLKGPYHIPNLRASSSGLQSRTDCDMTPEGDDEFNQRTVTPVSLGVLTNKCSRDFDNTFLADQFAAGADAPIPNNIMDWLIMAQMELLEEDVENLIWNGDTTIVDPNSKLIFMNGFIKLLANEGGYITTGGAAIAHTAATIKAEYAAVYTSIPLEMQRGDWKSKLVIRANQADAVLIDEMATAPALVNTNTGFTVSGSRYFYQGIEIIFSWAFPEDNLWLHDKKHLFIGSDLISEVAKLSAGLYPQPSDSAFIKGEFTLGINFFDPAYIVWRKTA